MRIYENLLFKSPGGSREVEGNSLQEVKPLLYSALQNYQKNNSMR